MEKIPEEKALLDIYGQLSNGNVLQLSREQRRVIQEVMTNSRGLSKGNVAENMLRILSEQTGDTLHLPPKTAELLREEIGALQRNETTALIAHPTLHTRLDDVEVCSSILQQLTVLSSFILPETEMLQFSAILEQTYMSLRENGQDTEFIETVFQHMKQLTRERGSPLQEPLFRVTLPPEVCDRLCRELRDTVQAVEKGQDV